MAEYRLKVAISVIGKISSGKSEFAKYVSQKHGIPIASFGGYVKHYCEENGLSLHRENLQNVGLSLVRTDHMAFLNKVIHYYENNSSTLIFDGVRNRVIMEAIRNSSEKHLSVYVSTDTSIRFQRYLIRKNNSDQMVTLEEFLRIDEHPIEQEIEDLKSSCDLVIAGDAQYPNGIFNHLRGILADQKE